MSYKTPMSRVFGLGPAKDGAGRWWAQRVSSVALIPLTLAFAFPFAGALGAGYDQMRALYAHPTHAIVAILFLGVTFAHLRQGLQVVIEDYVDCKCARAALLLSNTLLCGLLGAVGIFSVAKIAFGV